MAAKGLASKRAHRLLPFEREKPEASESESLACEFEETQIWEWDPSPPPPLEARSGQTPGCRIPRRSGKTSTGGGDRAAASSVPVDVPDWSKMLGQECRDGWRRAEEEERDWVPPHEFLAKQVAGSRTASFSLQEGVGRTLKGRDLRRVRNAVWEKIGFQD